MKRKIFSKLLMGAFLIASVSMFVSCKDYDDDISKNSADITALKSQLSTVESNLTSQLNSAKSDLASAKSALETAIAAKADASTVKTLSDDVTAAIGRISALEAQIATLDEYAKKADLANYATNEDVAAAIVEALLVVNGDIEDVKSQIKEVNGKVLTEEEITALIVKNAAAKTLETQVEALEKFQEKVTAANYLTADDLKGINEEIAALKKQISEIKIPEAVDIEAITKALEGQFQTLSEQIEGKVAANLSTINLFVNKKLTSIVLKPNFYWEGIEGIEAPFISQTPVFEKKGEYTFKYDLTNAPAGSGTVEVWVKESMGWKGLDGKRELGKYVFAGPNAAHADYPVWAIDAAGNGLTYNQSNVDNRKVEKLDIAYGATAKYNLNPSIADIEGATIGFFENDAPVYTRAADLSIEPEVIADGVKNNNGLLSVPFKVNYKNVITYFVDWTNSQTANWEGNAAAAKEDWTKFWYLRSNNTALYGRDDADAATDANIYNANLPFVALKIDVPANEEKGIEAYTVNSDWAVVVPALYQIVALADHGPADIDVLGTFDFAPAGAHEIRKNHLYETVGYDDDVRAMDANTATPRWNDKKGYGAIPMPATHGVLYNGSIDLSKYVRTHYNYLTSAQYGKSKYDAVLDDVDGGQLMKDLGLEYRYTIIDYKVGAETTSESAHIQQDAEKPSVFYPRSVDANGNTIKDQVATREACDREPLIRVDLVSTHDNDAIIRYGYIKLRITESPAVMNDLEVAIDLSKDLYMNCGDEAKITWSQVENLILAKLGQEGFTKKEFERIYKLDAYGVGGAGYEFMPYIDPTAIAGDTDNPGKLYTKTWQAKRYYKRDGDAPTSEMGLANGTDYALALDEYATNGIKDWTTTNNHFGEVWYTPHDNSTDGHDWDEQTNVLIWNFYPYDASDYVAGTVNFNTSRTVYSATVLDKEHAGNMNNAKYQKLMDVTGTTFETNGQSQKDVSTVVRFINKQTNRSLWVTLKVPAKMMWFEYGVVGKKDWSHWFGFNSSVPGESAQNDNKWAAWSDAEGVKYGSEFDAHINPFKPSNNNYNHLTVTDYNQLLTDNWLDPSKMVELQGNADNFTKFAAPNAPVISFFFTLPKKGVNSEKVTADENGQWNVKGVSGTVWTLALRDHSDPTLARPGNTAIVAVKKNDVAYGPEEICYIDETLPPGSANPVAYNNRIHYHGLEVTGKLYPAATDLVNKVGAYNKSGDARFDLGSGLNNMENALFLKDDVEETFTAYLILDVAHEQCYDPLIGKNFFNVRVHRPINVVGKTYEWVDRNLNDNRLAIKDLVEIVDWNRFPVVAYNTGKIQARNTMFGIEQPAYSTVYGNANTMKAQNVGIPFEYYGIKELAVRYDQIRTDHAKEPNIRRNIQDPESTSFKTNTDLVKDLNSLTSWREGNVLKTLSLLNADGTPVSFTIANAYNLSDENATGNGTQFGWLYYNNNASVVQEFHLYVPIAVKYNWGNIAYDVRLNANTDPTVLDKDYTQTVWAIVTVKGTN